MKEFLVWAYREAMMFSAAIAAGVASFHLGGIPKYHAIIRYKVMLLQRLGAIQNNESDEAILGVDGLPLH